MSFFKKIQKVLALLSPWAAAKPVKKKRGKKTVRRRAAVNKKITVVSKKPIVPLKPKKKQKSRVSSKPVKAKVRKEPVQPKSKPGVKKSSLVPAKKRLPVKKAPSARAQPAKLKRVLVGEVTHYFDRVQVAAFMITGAPIVLGDALEFDGKKGVFRQEIKSLQIDRVPVKSARAGDEVGIQVKKPVREGDYVFKVTG